MDIHYIGFTYPTLYINKCGRSTNPTMDNHVRTNPYYLCRKLKRAHMLVSVRQRACKIVIGFNTSHVKTAS